jgi:hypothetical protein
MFAAAARASIDRLHARRSLARRIAVVVDDDQQCQTGFVKVRGEWFKYRLQWLETPDGTALVTSFYIVVDDVEARERHTARKADLHGRYAREFVDSDRRDPAVAVFLRNHDVLPSRAFAIEGSPGDSPGSLREAIAVFRRRLSRSSARVMRLERLESSLLRTMPAERASRHDWSDVQPLDDYRIRRTRPTARGGDTAEPGIPLGLA